MNSVTSDSIARLYDDYLPLFVGADHELCHTTLKDSASATALLSAMLDPPALKGTPAIQPPTAGGADVAGFSTDADAATPEDAVNIATNNAADTGSSSTNEGDGSKEGGSMSTAAAAAPAAEEGGAPVESTFGLAPAPGSTTVVSAADGLDVSGITPLDTSDITSLNTPLANGGVGGGLVPEIVAASGAEGSIGDVALAAAPAADYGFYVKLPPRRKKKKPPPLSADGNGNENTGGSSAQSNTTTTTQAKSSSAAEAYIDPLGPAIDPANEVEDLDATRKLPRDFVSMISGPASRRTSTTTNNSNDGGSGAVDLLSSSLPASGLSGVGMGGGSGGHTRYGDSIKNSRRTSAENTTGSEHEGGSDVGSSAASSALGVPFSPSYTVQHGMFGSNRPAGLRTPFDEEDGEVRKKVAKGELARKVRAASMSSSAPSTSNHSISHTFSNDSFDHLDPSGLSGGGGSGGKGGNGGGSGGNTDHVFQDVGQFLKVSPPSLSLLMLTRARSLSCTHTRTRTHQPNSPLTGSSV
jgi:hypothetical protein